MWVYHHVLVPTVNVSIIPTWKNIGVNKRKWTVPAGSIKDSDYVIKMDERVWTPDAVTKLQWEVFVSTHCDQVSHQIAKQRQKIWKTSARGNTWQTKRLILCNHVCTVSKAKRHKSPSAAFYCLACSVFWWSRYHVRLIHCNSHTKLLHVLLMRDDLSGHSWLRPIGEADGGTRIQFAPKEIYIF